MNLAERVEYIGRNMDGIFKRHLEAGLPDRKLKPSFPPVIDVAAKEVFPPPATLEKRENHKAIELINDALSDYAFKNAPLNTFPVIYKTDDYGRVYWEDDRIKVATSEVAYLQDRWQEVINAARSRAQKNPEVDRILSAARR